MSTNEEDKTKVAGLIEGSPAGVDAEEKSGSAEDGGSEASVSEVQNP